MELKNQWNWLELINDSDNNKRFQTAKRAECTPLSISKENQSGFFSGSHGQYNTSLETCECIDFIRRKLPCKHMYRLAFELGVIYESFENDSTQIKHKPEGLDLADCVAIIENISDNAQKISHGILLDVIYHNTYSVVNLADAKELLEHNIIVKIYDPLILIKGYSKSQITEILKRNSVPFKGNASSAQLAIICTQLSNFDELFNEKIVVDFIPEFKKSERKLYTYLRRKFCTEEYWDPDSEEFKNIPAGSQFEGILNIITGDYELKLKFPDDEITHLLDIYGKNRCN